MNVYATEINLFLIGKNVLTVMVPILINKDVFEPSYNDLKFIVWNRNYICTNIMWIVNWWKWVAQSCPALCDPTDYTVHGILQARILEWVALSLLQGIFPTQRSNPGLPHCRRILYQLSHKESGNMNQKSPVGWGRQFRSTVSLGHTTSFKL